MTNIEKKQSNHIISALHRAERAIKHLSNKGVDVVGMSVKNGTLVINISRCGYCDTLIREGKASYIKLGTGAASAFRQGVYISHGCRVVWSESLH
ncbi:MAG: hypothetical protein ACRC9O_09520 [Plesiomonas sp.]|uniref:hypothetical protein n=1 Tax=Plesiomonas sp. TaxID=2486279 RepID=UPI003F3691C1